jgi:hypothetical protein
LIGASLVALSACGGAMAPEAKSSMPPAPPPSGSGGESTSAPTTPGLGGASAGADDVPHAQISFDDSVKAFEASGGQCASMCKALASMERAADHLCDLTKDGGADDKKRCDDAQAKVVNARERIKSSCGACE